MEKKGTITRSNNKASIQKCCIDVSKIGNILFQTISIEDPTAGSDRDVEHMGNTFTSSKVLPMMKEACFLQVPTKSQFGTNLSHAVPEGMTIL
jgi:hypothetical protein